MTCSCEEEDDGFHISSHPFEKPNHCLPCVSMKKKKKIVNQLVSLSKVILLAPLSMFWTIKEILVEQEYAHLVDQTEVVAIKL